MELIEEMAEALRDAKRYVGIYAHGDNVARRLNDNFAYLIDKYYAVVEDDEREQEENNELVSEVDKVALDNLKGNL